MIPPHLFYQIYLFFFEKNDCTPPKCGELSEYTDRGGGSFLKIYEWVKCVTLRQASLCMVKVVWALFWNRIHHPAYRIAHTMAFVTPVVEHWLEHSATYCYTQPPPPPPTPFASKKREKKEEKKLRNKDFFYP